MFKLINSGLNINIGGGENYFHTIYIDNLVDVIVKSIKLKSVLGEDFIVGDLKCPRMKDITKEIGLVLDKFYLNIYISKNLALFIGKFLGVDKTIRFVADDRIYDIKKVRKYFGLKTDIGISSGIEHTFEWYKVKNIL